MIRMSFVAGLLLALGCSTAPNEEVIHIKPPSDPLAPAKTIVQRYANGQALASEVTSFPKIVEDVRKTDPAKADILEKGLTEIEQASPAERPGIASELLKKLD